jgi:hypothetical protein
MSAVEARSATVPEPQEKLVYLDRMLLVVCQCSLSRMQASTTLASISISHGCLPLILMMVILVDRLPLRAAVASAIIDDCFMFVVGECFAIILTVRFVELKTVSSLAFLRGASGRIQFRRSASS